MKTSKISNSLAAFAAAVFLTGTADGIVVQNSSAASDTPTAPDAAVQKHSEPRDKSRGAAEILKLTRAKVGDDVMLAFIRNSGRRYTLTADEIVHLHNEGVSDSVINAMLTQPQRPAPDAQQTPTQSAAAYSSAAPAASPQYATTSPVYVMSDSASYGYSYYPYYSYYWSSPYWWYWYPSVSVGFGCWNGTFRHGDRFCWSGHRGGGFHGTGHPGGGWGGGGHPGGGHPGGAWSVAASSSGGQVGSVRMGGGGGGHGGFAGGFHGGGRR